MLLSPVSVPRCFALGKVDNSMRIGNLVFRILKWLAAASPGDLHARRVAYLHPGRAG